MRYSTFECVDIHDVLSSRWFLEPDPTSFTQLLQHSEVEEPPQWQPAVVCPPGWKGI